MTGYPITEEDRALIRQEWEAGTTITVIAAKLGRTRNSIMGLVHRMNLDSRPSPILTSSAPRVNNRRAMPAQIDLSALGPQTKFAPPPAGKCQWLEGHPRDLNFCDAPSVPGRSWCSEHFQRVFVPAVTKNAAAA